MMVSTRLRGAVIPTSVHKGFPRACTLRGGAYSSTLLLLTMLAFMELWKSYCNYEKVFSNCFVVFF